MREWRLPRRRGPFKLAVKIDRDPPKRLFHESA